MGDDVVSAYLQRKLSSNLHEAEADPNSPSWMISSLRSLEEQILEKSSSGCGIPADVLYSVMEAVSECRVFCYERPTAKAAVSKKGFFYFIRLLRHPLSEFLFEREMTKRLHDIALKLRSLSPAAAPRPPVSPQPQSEPISDIIGFEEEAGLIQKWLTLSSSDPDTFTEIVITGEWGCGKTALAHKVFATPSIENSFSPLIWVPLSGTIHEHEHEGRERVVKCIKEKIGQDKWDELNGKRYLVVLDNASWPWPGGLNLDLPKGSGAALILTTRHEHDFATHNHHVIKLQPQLSDEICWQIFSEAAVAKLDPAELLLSTIRQDVMRNSRGRALAVKTLGTIIPDLILQRKYWVRARDLRITWSDTSSYWIWRNLPPPEEMEEVAELLDVCWLDIIGSLELHKLLWNRSYSAFLVYKLKEERYSLDEKLWGGVAIVSKPGSGRDLYIDGDLSEATEMESGWLEIKLGEFVNDYKADGAAVEARLFQNGSWKSGLIVKGISFRLT